MERVNIILNRESWCAADDGLDHHLNIKVPKTISVPELVWTLYQKYLWNIPHGKWLAYSGDVYPDVLGDKLFVFDSKHPCKIDVLSDCGKDNLLPDKIYFKIASPKCSWEKEDLLENLSIQYSFTLFKEGFLSKIFKIRSGRSSLYS